MPVAAAPAARADEATSASPAAEADVQADSQSMEQASEPAGDVVMNEVPRAVASNPEARSTQASSSIWNR